MRVLIKAFAAGMLLASTGAMAQGMGGGQMNHPGDHPMNNAEHPMNNGDRPHVGMDHMDHGGTIHWDNRVEHRDMRSHRWSNNNRHRHCRWTWRHHHRVRVCSRW